MPPINLQPKLQHPAPPTKNSIISFPAPGVLLVHLNKPKDLNCINAEFTQELENIWLWLDEEPTLSVGIITGTGRAFCAGADLKGKVMNKVDIRLVVWEDEGREISSMKLKLIQQHRMEQAEYQKHTQGDQRNGIRSTFEKEWEETDHRCSQWDMLWRGL